MIYVYLVSYTFISNFIHIILINCLILNYIINFITYLVHEWIHYSVALDRMIYCNYFTDHGNMSRSAADSSIYNVFSGMISGLYVTICDTNGKQHEKHQIKIVKNI